MLDYKTAKDNFLNIKIQGCKKFFASHNHKLEQAYSEIIFDDLHKAKKLFEELKDEDMRAHWGLVLIGFIRGKVSEVPTYLELRNFLEIDLNILINYAKGNYVEKIVRYANYMYTINPESYKFIGRVFLNNGLKPQALFFLQLAKDYFYQDPELHYMLAEMYFKDKNFEQAKRYSQSCLQVLPEYAPAVSLLRKIN